MLNKQLILLFTLFLQCLRVSAQSISFKTDDLNLTLSETGQLSGLINPLSHKNHLAVGEKAPLLKIRIHNEWEDPNQLVFDKKSSVIILNYPNAKTSAEIKVVPHHTHLVFELIRLNSKEKVNAVYWGPFPTTIRKTIGEVVGVVRDGKYAIGIQALNTKTIGGLLQNEAGSIDSRGSTATVQSYGSSLQSFSLDRSTRRMVTVWGQNYPDMPVEAIPNETTIGSKIALFGCPETQVLQHIGSIELAEGLPHPLIRGIWHKESPETGRAYLISDFNESNIDTLLDYTQQAGLVSLYHEGPFQSWGHFILDSTSFPHGRMGMKRCVEKAANKGLRIGVHTLSTFININDPYVTPIPDTRLAITGSSVLTENIFASSTEIGVESNQYFKNVKPSTLHAVRIGAEIIRFREVSVEKSYKLLDCQRGAYGTKASNHNVGEAAGMLMDYPYNTLFPDFNLQQEIAVNLGHFFTETGVSQMDFDGHEGCQSAGEGDYGIQAFAEKVFQNTEHTLVNGTSTSSHYYWHICHYWNWGEPWYGGFRESQGDYRLENQPFLERNYMPNMLGWFLLSSTTTAEDIEWMMARAAGYHAGFALVARYKNLKTNPQTTQLLSLINLWQKANTLKLFSPDQLSRLKNPENDFHLEHNNHEWKLYPFKKQKFEHDKKILQPGQPTCSEWEFTNRDGDQPLNFTLTIMGKEGAISNPWIELDGYLKLELPGTYDAGHTIACDGATIKVYNSKGGYQKEINLIQSIPMLKTGKHIIKFDCKFPEEHELTNRIIIKTRSSPEIILK